MEEDFPEEEAAAEEEAVGNMKESDLEVTIIPPGDHRPQKPGTIRVSYTVNELKRFGYGSASIGAMIVKGELENGDLNFREIEESPTRPLQDVLDASPDPFATPESRSN